MRPLVVVALLLVPLVLAGCTSPAPPARDPGQGFNLITARLDSDGDGLYDSVNVTLVAAPGPVEPRRLSFLVDGSPVNVTDQLAPEGWRPGRSVVLPCPPGLNEVRVLIDDRLRKVVVHECGVAAPTEPPLFQGRLIDGDGNGETNAVELTLLSGGPVDPAALNATMGGEALGVYRTPLLSQLARQAATNGTRLYTPCVPGPAPLNLTWRGQALPPLQLSGCAAFTPGLHAPVHGQELDIDQDGVQDGWNLTLGGPAAGPFALSSVEARWDSTPVQVNGSVALAPPPEAWATGSQLVVPCPGDGTFSFSLRIQGHLVFRVGATPCQAPPGQPLLDLELDDEEGGHLALELVFSRLEATNASEITTPDGSPVGQGTWEVGGQQTVACPGGQLVLLHEGRLAFRGEAPC